MAETQLAVSEIFGPTVQGEGPSTGRNAVFVRLAGCNLDCHWCDTPYTWDWSRYSIDREVTLMTPAQIVNRICNLAPHWHLGAGGQLPLIVFTGGEPLLQVNGLNEVAMLLRELREPYHSIDIEVETNGTRKAVINDNRPPRVVNVRYNVSPKLAHSGVSEVKRAVDYSWWNSLGHDLVRFKFVCESVDDVREVTAIIAATEVNPRLVWIMPEGTTAERLDERIDDGVLAAAIREGFNFTDRAHIRAWGDQRGK